MKSNTVRLHVNNKRTLFLIVFFCVLSIISNLLILVSNKAYFSQLNVLYDSSYYYSVTMNNTVSSDCYYQYSAGIGFTTDAATNKGINADVLMQTEDSQYTDSIYWNAKKLKDNQIAISRSIANDYNLQIGDYLYSKHTVSGDTIAYVIDEILPPVYCSRVSENDIYTSGIIVMAYDQLYVDNTSHNSMVFTNQRIDELSSNPLDTPTNIVYRKDEISTISQTLFPYICLNVIASVTLVIALCILLNKSVKYNTKRLIVLGFDSHKINHSFYRYIYFSGISLIMISLAATILSISLLNLDKHEIVLYLIISFIDVLVLFVSSVIMKHRMWRK